MEYWAWSLLLRPFVVFFLVLLVLAPAVWLVKRYVPEGKLKRFLLYRWDGTFY